MSKTFRDPLVFRFYSGLFFVKGGTWGSMGNEMLLHHRSTCLATFWTGFRIIMEKVDDQTSAQS